MGEALAIQLGREGAAVALVARREQELERVRTAVEAAGGTALCFSHDVTNPSEVPLLFQEITKQLGGLDLIIYAAGVMPLIEPNEYSFDKDEATILVNCTGAVAWLNEGASRFEHTKSGVIVGISSVAGDRGRRGFPVYGASKAFMDSYMESLRNRLTQHYVQVTTIKPGPVDTPMTKDVKKKPLLISADEAAASILRAVAKRKQLAYVPGTWRIIMKIVCTVPSFIFRKLNF